MKKNISNLDFKNPENWVISEIIAYQCKKYPEFEIIKYLDGESWTYKKLYIHALQAANLINSLGVKKGDVVLAIIDNPKKFIPLWIGASFLGVIFVAINPSLKGAIYTKKGFFFELEPFSFNLIRCLEMLV